MAKKIIITFLVVMLASILGILYALPTFIDKETIKSQLSSSFKQLTGLDLEIQGEVKVERFPTPHVLVNSLYVHNARGTTSPFLLTIRLAEIWPSYKSILSKSKGISKINFDGVEVDIERLKNDQMNWQDSSVQTSVPEGVSGLASNTNSGLTGTYFTITNGYLRYTDLTSNTSSEYKDIGIVFLNGGDKSDSTLNLNLTYKDRQLSVSGKMGSISHALSVGEVPANLNIISGRSHLNYEGNAGYKNNKFTINGNVKLATDDIVPWVSTISGTADEKPVLGVTYKPLPMAAQSDITTDNGKIIFPNLTLEGNIIKGGARIEISPPYGIDIKSNISSLDLETLFASKLFALKQIADPLNEAINNSNKEAAFLVTPKTFLDALNLSADIKLDDTLYNQQHIKDTHIEFDMNEGEMTIAQSTAILPGGTHVFFTGLGKEGIEGFALEGEVDASGDDFTEALKILKANGAALPNQDFKRFKLKANTILSSKEMRMSEITARIENIAIVGGFIATYGDRIKLNAAMRIGGLNIDHFAEIWGLDKWHASLFDNTPDAKYDSFLARWLRRLDYDVTVNVALEQYILAGLPREKADLKLQATSGKVVLNDLKTSFNGSQIAGSIGLDVTGSLPRLDLKLTTDVFDMATFFTKDGKPLPEDVKPQLLPVAPQPQPPQPPPVPLQSAPLQASQPVVQASDIPHWSRDQFDFHWMELLNATFHFKFGQYKEGRITAQSLDVQGTVENRALNIDAITGYVLGAQIAAKATITAGKIPSANIAANISSLDPVQIVTFFPLLDGMTGRYNLSLRLDSSGIDMYSWIASLEGTIGLGGNDVNIHGFNLPGVIRSVSYVRTVADILNVVRRAFPGGDTQFSNIEGQWSVAGGVLKTSNTRMTNGQADGVLTSQVDLLNWRMQSSISLALKILDPAHPPGMIITFNGSLAKPETALDTRSLERYVTNKTSERMLQEYGTQ